MERIQVTLLVVLVFSIILVAGCSQDHVDPVLAQNPLSGIPVMDQTDDPGNHEVVGIWTAVFDLDSMTVSVESDRDASVHFNVRPYLPDPGITLNAWDPVNQVVDIDLTIDNIYNINVFDVRLIVFTDSAGHTLTYADDWTALHDIPGGLPINPFKSYAKSETNRRFAAYSQHTENLLVKLPGMNPNVNFAIDVSFPGNCEEPYEIGNFTQHRSLGGLNSTATVSFDVLRWNQEVDQRAWIYCPSLFGGSIVEIPTSDNQHFSGDITNYTGAPEGEYSAVILAKTEGSSLYLFDFAEIQVAEDPGTGWVAQINDSTVITVASDNDGNVYAAGSEFGELMKYNDEPTQQWARNIRDEDNISIISDLFFDDYVHVSGTSICVGSYQPGYAAGVYGEDNTRHWGKLECEDPLGGMGMTTIGDGYGNSILSIAYYGGSITIGVYPDAMLKKIEISGAETWTRDFANPDGSMVITGLAFSESESILATGYFQGTLVDFDPTAGEVPVIPHGSSDGFLLELTSNGLYSEVVHWGSEYANLQVQPMVQDSNGNLYIQGQFFDTVDFDPGPGVFSLTAGTSGSTFITKFDPDLDFIHAIKLDFYASTYWGSIAMDSNDNLYVTGSFNGTLDFDPGSSVEERTAVSGYDVFLLKLTKDFDFTWVRTWGSLADEQAYDVACNKSTNAVYVVGYFGYTMDFDPGDGVYELTPTDNMDSFLLKVLPNGYWE